MAFIHLGNSVNSVFVIINTKSPDLTMWTDWVQTKFWLATGFCVYIVHKAIERFLSNAVERQSHHVGSAIAQGQGVCATRSFSKSKYLAKVWSMSSFILLCSVMLVALAVGAIKEKATVMLG